MSDTENLVKSYLAAIAARDFDLARTYLADRGFSYTSPIDRFEDADRFIQSITAVGQILARIEIRKCLVSSNEGIVILDIIITLSGYESRTVALLFLTEGGYIKSMEAIFDATEYHKMFSSQF
jgi:hypothetical protein